MSETLVPKFKSAYDPSQSKKYDVSKNINPSLTKQAFQKECDINTIMAKYQKTGLIDHNNSVQGRYGDFITSHDYQSALDEIHLISDAFASLPSSVRSRFENDPAAFLDFTQNPENTAEMRELGLMVPEPIPTVEPAPLADPSLVAPIATAEPLPKAPDGA